jgi:glycosyltransferase involved in cell wall biosynthesis
MAAALATNVPDFSAIHLHSVFLWPTYAAASVARRVGIPYVLAPRGMLVPELVRQKSRLAKSLWISLIERRNIAGASAVHVTSGVEARDLAALRLSARRVAIIPNGIDVPPDRLISSACVSNEKRGSGERTVLCLGRISWKKGLDRLIMAMRHAPGAHLVLAGNDDEGCTPQLENIARQCGVEERTHFIGPLHGDAKWRAIANADVFALASHSENFGVAVLEAMACGVPVVVTPQVGLAETVARSGAGLVAPNDPTAFGAAINSLLSDWDLRRRMGMAGRAVASEEFAWGAIAAEVETLYKEIQRDRAGA